MIIRRTKPPAPVIKHMWSWLFHKRKLTDVERQILNAVRAKLCPEASKLLDLQIGEINKVQRIVRGIEVDFYAMKNGRVEWSSEHFFKCTEIKKLAQVRINSIEIGAGLMATVTIGGGHIFSIEYNQEPDSIIGSNPIEIIDVKILLDPMMGEIDEIPR